MCLLTALAISQYCMKRACSGSCAMEICCLSFLVMISMMVCLATLYFVLPYFYSEDKGRLNRGLETKCEKSRIIGVLEKIYPDGDQFKLKCTGLNFGENLGVTLTECFDHGNPNPKLHYLSSGSSYWNKGNKLHKIIKYSMAKEKDQSITIMEVDPALPEPCPLDDDNVKGDDNYFYIEQQYHPNANHTLVGWEYMSRKAETPLHQIPVSGKCIPGYPSAVVFTKNGYFTGFQRGKCTEEDSFEESLVPYSMYLEKIQELYPNVELKGNVPPPVGETNTQVQNILLKGQIEHKVDQTTSPSMKNIEEADTFHSGRVNDINIDWKNDNKGKITKGTTPTGQFAIRRMHPIEFEPPLPVDDIIYCASQLSRTALCSECMLTFKCCQHFNRLGCKSSILRLCRTCGSQPGVEECCKQFGIWLKQTGGIQLVPEIAKDDWRFHPVITDSNMTA